MFIWRNYFGPQARIIGVEFNPLAKYWEQDGFEIHIGSQSDPIFWQNFFKQIGDVDIVLDDGGHTYEQQIVTAHECIPYIKNGGLLIVEDTHTSYFKSIGYPTKYSFIEWINTLINKINDRFPAANVYNLPYKSSVFSISIFESIVSFKINRKQCFESAPTVNIGASNNTQYFRYHEIEDKLSLISGEAIWLKKLKKSLAKRIAKFKIARLKQYF